MLAVRASIFVRVLDLDLDLVASGARKGFRDAKKVLEDKASWREVVSSQVSPSKLRTKTRLS